MRTDRGERHKFIRLLVDRVVQDPKKKHLIEPCSVPNQTGLAILWPDQGHSGISAVKGPERVSGFTPTGNRSRHRNGHCPGPEPE
jgi:hypothetical protein